MLADIALVLVPLVILLAGAWPSVVEDPPGLSQAAEVVRAQRQAGDMVFMVGVETPTELFDGLPYVYRWTEAEMPPGGLRKVGVPRVWLVDARAQRSVPPELGLAAAERTWRLGEVALSLHEVYDDPFLLHLADAKVDLGSGAATGCKPSGGGAEFECPAHPWARAPVRAMPLHVAKRLVDCIRVLPVPGKELRVRFPSLPIRDRLVLRTTTLSFVPIEVGVTIDGREVARFEQPRTEGWQTHDVATGDLKGTDRTVELTFGATGAGEHRLCFVGGT